MRIVFAGVSTPARPLAAPGLGLSGIEERVRELGGRLQSKDDSVGMPARPLAAPGLGVLGIEERVRELGGRLQLYSQPGQGTSLKIEMPVPVCV